jgi:PKD repeat protein
VSIGAAANGLAAGQYAGTIRFNNTATQAFTTRNVGLTVLWPPPVAAFSGSPTSGKVPLAVTFTDTSTGNITGRFWDFGDGSTTNTVTNSLVHTYLVAGTYPVTLIATGPGGAGTNAQPGYVTALTPYQAWQIQYFDSTNNPSAAPDADADGTGQNNLLKFTAGLDPTNAASVFRMTSMAQEGGNIRATWSCVGGHDYVLQSTTNTTGGGYSNQFVDISPVIVVPGLGESTTNYDVIGVLAGAGDTPVGTGTNTHSSQSTASTIAISALYSRGLADSSGVVPTNSLVILGTFGISESAIRSCLTTGGVSAVLSAFTTYGAPFAVGDGSGIPASWDVVVNATGFGGEQIYLVAFDQPTVAASTQMGIFTAPSWVFPGDGSPLVIKLEDVTDFVIGAHGGPLTIDSVGYTFDDSAQLAFIPVPSRFYRVRLGP